MEYDFNLEGHLPRLGPQRPRREKYAIDPDVQRYLSHYLGRVRKLQDIYYDKNEDNQTGGKMKEAFSAALQIMEQWLGQTKNYEGVTTIGDTEMKLL